MLAGFLGKPLTEVPDPFGEHASFGAHNNARLRAFLDRFGFDYEFVSSTERYRAGAFDAALRNVLRNQARFGTDDDGEQLLQVECAALDWEECAEASGPTDESALAAPLRVLKTKRAGAPVQLAQKDGLDGERGELLRRAAPVGLAERLHRLILRLDDLSLAYEVGKAYLT